MVETGTLNIYPELKHGFLALALRAAEQGVNFVASKSMLTADIPEDNPYVKVTEYFLDLRAGLPVAYHVS